MKISSRSPHPNQQIEQRNQSNSPSDWNPIAPWQRRHCLVGHHELPIHDRRGQAGLQAVLIKVYKKAYGALLEQVLRGAGYLATQIEDDHEAFWIMRDMRVALLVVDYLMPGMGGQEYIYWIRKDPSLEETKTLLLLPQGAQEMNYHVLADAVLAKPFGPQEFLRMVNKLVLGTEDAESHDVSESKQGLPGDRNVRQRQNVTPSRERMRLIRRASRVRIRKARNLLAASGGTHQE